VANLNQHKLAGDKRKGRRGRDDGAITVDMLIEILEESIRMIWQFIRADKDVSTMIPTCRRDTRVELQDPADSVLLLEVRADLQKVTFFNFPFTKTPIFFLCF
jgi:hypothetical protein